MPEQSLRGFELNHQRGRAREEWRKKQERELERQRREQALRKAQTIASIMLPEWGGPTTVRVLEAAVAVARDAIGRNSNSR
jgi:ribosomal protein S8E